VAGFIVNLMRLPRLRVRSGAGTATPERSQTLIQDGRLPYIAQQELIGRSNGQN
jgi:hypothetical protein